MTRTSILALALMIYGAPDASAHDVDVTSVARVFLDQIGERRYVFSVVDTKVPPVVGIADVLPAGCAPLPEGDSDVRVVQGFVFDCEAELTFDDALELPWPLAGVVVLARWADGTEASGYFRGNGRTVSVGLGDLRAGAGTRLRLATRYFWLGGEHILFGLDHLLFVAGLLLLLSGLGALVMTITAFTIAHTITLGLAVLGYVPVSRGPVEAGIALSIVLLAREIIAGHRGRRHLVHRWPWVVAFVFGLLHGLGFAGALGDIGLRGGDIPMALLFFNLGVEAGQLAFVVAIVAAHRAFRPFVGIAPKTATRSAGKYAVRTAIPRLRPVLGYALGVMATFWFFDRLPAIWAG